MIKGIIKQAVIEILIEQKLINDPYEYKAVRDTQTRVSDIEDVLRTHRDKIVGLEAALEICYTDDIDIEKKYRHKKWKDITKEERDLLCKRYNIAFGITFPALDLTRLGAFIASQADYIGDTLKEKKEHEERVKRAVESSTKKAKKNARRK